MVSSSSDDDESRETLWRRFLLARCLGFSSIKVTSGEERGFRFRGAISSSSPSVSLLRRDFRFRLGFDKCSFSSGSSGLIAAAFGVNSSLSNGDFTFKRGASVSDSLTEA